MNRKSLWIIVFAFILLVTFAAASADQDGRNCWCNIDDYGCWITDEDGGTIYIMFWSEEARQYIMGAGSPPYKNVVTHPGSTGILPIECGRPEPVLTPVPKPSDPQDPDPDPQDPDPDPQDPCDDYGDCMLHCWDIRESCDFQSPGDELCSKGYEYCSSDCRNRYPGCNN